MLKSLAQALIPQKVREWRWERQYQRALPEAARLEDARDRQSPLPDDPGAEKAVVASLGWLARAQDCSTSGDGGVSRHFSLVSGWAESYPETTGYIIPTMISCATDRRDSDLLDRSRRMLDWCVDIQFPDGGFQGGLVSAVPRVPTTFNTGQILLGLCAGTKAFGTTSYESAMHKAASWLRDTQDTDGCWRRFSTPFAQPGEKTYETHVSWGLFEAARLAPGCGYGEAGLRQIKWALTKQTANGWFVDCCLNDPVRPLTHTIGYVLRGLLEAHNFSPDEIVLDAASRTGRAVLSAMQPNGLLPGRLTADWRPAVPWVCLTGSVQIAHCWLLLYQLTDDQAFLDGARKANAFVRRTVKIQGDSNVVGGVKGAFPVSGHYGRYEYLNWAAKFFVDSNLEELRLGS